MDGDDIRVLDSGSDSGAFESPLILGINVDETSLSQIRQLLEEISLQEEKLEKKIFITRFGIGLRLRFGLGLRLRLGFNDAKSDTTYLTLTLTVTLALTVTVTLTLTLILTLTITLIETI
jgi:hypothetical protein